MINNVRKTLRKCLDMSRMVELSKGGKLSRCGSQFVFSFHKFARKNESSDVTSKTVAFCGGELTSKNTFNKHSSRHNKYRSTYPVHWIQWRDCRRVVLKGVNTSNIQVGGINVASKTFDSQSKCVNSIKLFPLLPNWYSVIMIYLDRLQLLLIEVSMDANFFKISILIFTVCRMW